MVENNNRDLMERVEKLDERVTSLESDNRLITYQYDEIKHVMREVQADLRELKGKPGERWNNATQVIFASFITALITGLVAMLFF